MLISDLLRCNVEWQCCFTMLRMGNIDFWTYYSKMLQKAECAKSTTYYWYAMQKCNIKALRWLLCENPEIFLVVSNEIESTCKVHMVNRWIMLLWNIHIHTDKPKMRCAIGKMHAIWEYMFHEVESYCQRFEVFFLHAWVYLHCMRCGTSCHVRFLRFLCFKNVCIFICYQLCLYLARKQAGRHFKRFQNCHMFLLYRYMSLFGPYTGWKTFSNNLRFLYFLCIYLYLARLQAGRYLTRYLRFNI